MSLNKNSVYCILTRSSKNAFDAISPQFKRLNISLDKLQTRQRQRSRNTTMHMQFESKLNTGKLNRSAITLVTERHAIQFITATVDETKLNLCWSFSGEKLRGLQFWDHSLRLGDPAYKINTRPQEDKKLRRKTITTINVGEMTYISARSIRGCNCCRLM